MPPDQPVASLHGASGSGLIVANSRRDPPSLRPCLRAAPEGPSRAREGSVRPTASGSTRVKSRIMIQTGQCTADNTLAGTVHATEATQLTSYVPVGAVPTSDGASEPRDGGPTARTDGDDGDG